MKNDRNHEQRDDPPPSHLTRDWVSFFALEIDVPEDSLRERDDSPPQSRELPWWPA